MVKGGVCSNNDTTIKDARKRGFLLLLKPFPFFLLPSSERIEKESNQQPFDCEPIVLTTMLSQQQINHSSL